MSDEGTTKGAGADITVLRAVRTSLPETQAELLLHMPLLLTIAKTSVVVLSLISTRGSSPYSLRTISIWMTICAALIRYRRRYVCLTR